MKCKTPRRLADLGYEVTSDFGGGYEIWCGRARVGRVFSRAALERWTPPEPESVSESRAKHRAAGQLEFALEV